MTLNLSPDSEFPRIRWAIFCLVFFAIPMFLICFWYGKLWTERDENRKLRTIQKYEESLSKIAQWDKPVVFFEMLLRQVQRKLSQSQDPTRLLPRIFKSLKGRFPGVIETTVLNSKGEVHPELTDGKPPRMVLKRFMQDYLAMKSGEEEPMQRRWSLYRAHFGSLLKVKEAGQAGELLTAAYTPRHSYIYFSRQYPFGLFFLFFNQTADWDILAFRDRLRNRSTTDKKVPIALFDIAKKEQGDSLPPEFQGKNVEKIVAQFATNPQTYLFSDGLLWVQKMVTPTHRLLTFTEILPDPKIHQQRTTLVLAITLIFGFLALYSWKIMVEKQPFYLSIRLKLLFLFLYAVGLPLIIMTINARDYIYELRFRLENQLQIEVESSLTSFEKKFPQQLGSIQAILQRAFSSPISSTGSVVQSCVRKVDSIARVLNPSEATLINEAGEILTEQKKGSEVTKRVKLLKPIYVTLLKNINTTQPDLEEFQESSASKMAAAAGVDTDALYADWAKSLGKVKEMKLGERKAVQAFFPILDETGKARFLVLFAWSHFSLQRRYLQKYLFQMERQLPETKVFARAQEPDKPGHHSEKMDFPLYFRQAPLIQDFIKKMLAQGQGLHAKIKKGETTYLLTGVRGENLSCYYLVGVSSDRKIRETIDHIYWQLKWVSLALICVSLTVGTFLARKFLEPVGQLAAGVHALRARDFQLRIPVMDQDELGDLSSTFNDMMESMADLEVARIVQESLFSMEPISINGCSIFGSCQPATQVGGDYFDYFPLSDNRIGVIIGDVSGHGVPAAMVMAMAKATIVNMGVNMPDPGSVLLTLHNLLLKTLKKKRMMTCFLAVIDPANKRLTFSNAGQNNPFLTRQKQIIPLTGAGYPLGSRSKASYTNQDMPLEWGDRIIFYTDGLIEANALDGDMVGYRRLEDIFPKSLGATPTATENALREWHKAIIAPGPQADDITILIIHFDPPAGPPQAKLV